MTAVPFADWAPDVAALNTDATDEVINVLCGAGYYQPFPSLAALSDAIGATPLGGFVARTLSGQVSIFVGTATQLFKLNNTTLAWDDVSQTAVTYGATSTALWSFAQFGENVVAVNLNDDPQVFDLSSDTEFSDLGGSPPRANVVRAWGDVLALHQLANNQNRVQWSGINDITEWTPGTNNSDFQDFPDGGVVQGSSETTNPIIFLERSIYIGTFIPGSTEVFSFQKVHDRRGAKSALSIATRGAFVFYADDGGFFRITPDGSIDDIGFEKVDRTVFETVAAADVANIQGAVDPFYSRVYWAADFGGTGDYDTLLVYDWNLGRWSQAKVDMQIMFPAAAPGFTLEGLDNVNSSVDALSFSLDSKVWQGGAPVLAAVDLDGKLGFFNGSSMEATIATQEMGDAAGDVTLVKDAYAVVDANDPQISFGSRMLRGSTVTWSDYETASTVTGRVYKRVASRFHRFRTKIPAGSTWSKAQGVDVTRQQAGRR